jgi:hypothetical protein
MKRYNERECYKQNENFLKIDISVPNIEVFYKNYSTNEKPGAHVCAFFSGKKFRADWVKQFNNELEMYFFVDKSVQKIYDNNNRKTQQRIKNNLLAKERRKEIFVDDIFATSWGYENTYVDFYQVVERISASRVKVQRINYKVHEVTSFASQDISPIKDDFIGEPEIKTINKYGCISKIDIYGHSAYKTSIDSKHHTSWGY